MSAITIEQIETPALIIDLDILEGNIEKMADFLKDKPAKLMPHFKTNKCPKIAHMQIAAGANGITCAKLEEAEILIATGISNIVIANQVVDAQKVYRLAALANNVKKLTVCVDNTLNVAELSKAATEYGSKIYILVEVEVGMRRCGVNTKEEVLALARQITDSNGLVFDGLQVYAGQLSHNPDEGIRQKGIKEVVAKTIEVKKYLEMDGISVNEINGDGTGTYYILGGNTIWTEIQAGSYVFMDTVYDELNLGFKKALTVLVTVIHKRHGVAITDAGLKVCGTDQGLPTIKGYPEMKVVLNEEHGIIEDNEDKLKYLQKIEYEPAHCCSTVNLHDSYYCVRNGLLEAIWPISGRGKSR